MHFLWMKSCVFVFAFRDPMGPTDNKSALVQVMSLRRTGDKPLPEPMTTYFTDAYMRHKGGVELGELSRLRTSDVIEKKTRLYCRISIKPKYPLNIVFGFDYTRHVVILIPLAYHRILFKCSIVGYTSLNKRHDIIIQTFNTTLFQSKGRHYNIWFIRWLGTTPPTSHNLNQW